MPPLTAREPGDGTGTITYKIPGAGLDVETVRVAVDATGAGGAVTATVTITDPSGVVIATKPQNATIPAGAIGSATWALRLDDESAGGATTNAVLYDTSPQVATFLESTTTNGTTINDKGVAGTGIALESDDGSGGGGFVSITTGDGEVFVGSTSIVERFGNGGTYQLQRQGAAVIIFADNNGAVTIRLGNAQELNVLGPFSRPIMKITDGGGGAPTYEIKTGAAWVADL